MQTRTQSICTRAQATCTHAHAPTCVYNPHQVRQSAAAGLRREGNWRLVVVPGAGSRGRGNGTWKQHAHQRLAGAHGRSWPSAAGLPQVRLPRGRAKQEKSTDHVMRGRDKSRNSFLKKKWFVPVKLLLERADGSGQPWDNAGLRPRTSHRAVCWRSTAGRRVSQYARHGRKCG
jgi:hypothetical protein